MRRLKLTSQEIHRLRELYTSINHSTKTPRLYQKEDIAFLLNLIRDLREAQERPQWVQYLQMRWRNK